MNKIFEQLLKARGLKKDFLEPKYEDLNDPLVLFDMKKALKRLKAAVKKNEKVLVYGDYDVDGVTATAIMLETLKLAGITEVETMLPDRFVDGYGMSDRLIERAVKDSVDLVMTVDCGSNNTEIIEELKNKGIDVIVTDHHEFGGDVPGAVAVINPKRPDFCGDGGTDGGAKTGDKTSAEVVASLRELAGAGVAFMLAKALADDGMIPKGQEKWLLDLAMIGTICDSMKLTGDNRIICKFGAIVASKTRRVGLRELMRVAGVNRISTEAIGFQIGPRLNAAGRMQTAELALKLLTTNSKVEAAKIAEELDELNRERRSQQREAVAEVEERGGIKDPVIVVGGEWHEGIVGIIAGRLTERHRKPSFVLAEVDGYYKGSGRSFGEFNLALALEECQDVIVSGGGHAAACGVKLEKERIGEFKEKINAYYRSLKLENQERFLEAKEDLALDDLDGVDLSLVEEMRKLEPFGNGNPEPVFLLENMLVQDVRKMGDNGQHLGMLLRDEQGKTIKLVAFYARKSWLNIEMGTHVNVWANLIENEWNGVRSVEGRILKLEHNL